MIDIQELASISGLTEEKVKTFLPGVLQTIRNYTHKAFITSVNISGEIIIEDGQIQVEEIPSKLIAGSQIELKGSINNTKIYTIKSIENNIITTNETLYDDTFTGYIIKLNFNIDESVIAGLITFKNSTVKQTGVKSESTDGYSYQLNIDSTNSYQGYPSNLLSSIDHLRQLPGSELEEYYRLGYIS